MASELRAQPCDCEDNLLWNGEIRANRANTEDLRDGTSDQWFVVSETPQVAAGVGCEPVPGFLQLWGNRPYRECVRTPLKETLIPGQAYDFSACVRFLYENTSLFTKYARVVFLAKEGRTGRSEFIMKVQMSHETWETYGRAAWRPRWAATELQVWVENDNAGTNSASWGQIDNICLERSKVDPGSLSFSVDTLFRTDTMDLCDPPLLDTLAIRAIAPCWMPYVLSSNIIGEDSADYTIVDAPLGVMSEYDSVRIQFKPSDSGLHTATLRLVLGDSTIHLIPLRTYVRPRIPLVLTSSMISTDTIGAVICLPLSFDASAEVEAIAWTMSYDPSALVFQSVTNALGDTLEVSAVGPARFRTTFRRGQPGPITGCAYFTVYPGPAACTEIRVTTDDVLPPDLVCKYSLSAATATVCTPNDCTARLVSEYMRGGTVPQLAVSMADNEIRVSTTHDHDIVRIQVYSVLGIPIVERYERLSPQHTVTVNTSAFARGLYLIEVSSAFGRRTASVLVR